MRINNKLYGDFNVLVLAGGESSRMKYPKAWLPFSDDESFLEHIVNSYLNLGCTRIVVVLNEKFIDEFNDQISGFDKEVIIATVSNPELGRLNSLKIGLKNLGEEANTLIHNVDNPFVNSSTIKKLLKSTKNGYSKPVKNQKGGHPISVSPNVINSIYRAEPSMNLRELLNEHDCTTVAVNDLSIFYNVNTPTEYHQIFLKEVPNVVKYLQ